MKASKLSNEIYPNTKVKTYEINFISLWLIFQSLKNFGQLIESYYVCIKHICLFVCLSKVKEE